MRGHHPCTCGTGDKWAQFYTQIHVYTQAYLDAWEVVAFQVEVSSQVVAESPLLV